MSHPIDVRPARPEDARALSELLGQLGYTSAAEHVSRRLVELSESKGDTVLVAIDKTTPIGVLSLHLIPLFHRDGCIGRITALVIREDFRSSGVGATLIRHCEQYARTHGAERLEVTSGDQRTRAHEFYCKNGFRRESQRFTKAL